MSDGREPGFRRRRVTFALGILAFYLVLIESLAGVAAHVVPNLFNDVDEDRLQFLSSFDGYERYLERNFDARTGWHSRHSTTYESDNCLGERFRTTLDAHGARKTALEGEPRIVIVGDSYTLGQEVSDEDTYASRLAERLQLPVANLGIAAFGPLQAIIRLEEMIELYPEAEVVVLAIMYENIRRMRNSYRPAYHAISNFRYGFKPFLEIHDEVAREMPSPNQPRAESPEALRTRIEEAFRTDYWATAPRGFPYTLALYRTLQHESVWLRLLGNIRQALGGSEFSREYQHPDNQAGLLALARRLTEFSSQRGLEARIVFLPEDTHGLGDPEALVARINAELGRVIAADAGTMSIDWSTYNLRPGRCHPSPAGHGAIAEFVASFLERTGAL